MTRIHDRLTTSAVLCLAGLVSSVLGLAACSESGGGSNPTAPPPPPAAAGSASVSGQITGVSGAAAGTVGAAGIGVTVRIQGTSLSTATDAAGRFDLGGVPGGDQVVLFETAATTAPLPIHGIETGELIELVVALDGSTVQVQSMSRSKGGEDPPELSLELQPDTWNTNWAHSSGTVSALIRGEGFEDVDLDSIVLVGTDPEAEPLAPTRVDRQGNHVRAFFAQSESFATLDDPQPGETHTVTIELTVEGEPLVLTDDARIVGPGEPSGDASIDLEKATEGQDADRPPGPSIPVGDPVSWTYVVTNTGEVPLTEVTVTDDQGVDVDCPADALEPGESMTCTGSGVAEEGQYRNVGTAVGVTPDGDDGEDEDPSHYFGEEEEEPEPVDLTVEMQPASWNTNWTRSAGTVSAFIRGSGFASIDLDSIVLIGTDPGADPLAPTRVDRQGNHVRAFFAQSEAIAVLETPQPGEVHTLTVELTVAGEPVSLSTDVRVVGPPV
jgi:hypothetical protein